MKKLLLTTAIFMALSTSAMAKTYTVKMVTNSNSDKMYYFEPDKLTVQLGDTVKWVNVQEDGGHNVMKESGPEGSKPFSGPLLMKKGASYSVTFDGKEGTYEYHCHPHGSLGMTGTVIVGHASPINKGKMKMKMPMNHDMKSMMKNMDKSKSKHH